jgi:hypothetical protein
VHSPSWWQRGFGGQLCAPHTAAGSAHTPNAPLLRHRLRRSAMVAAICEGCTSYGVKKKGSSATHVDEKGTESYREQYSRGAFAPQGASRPNYFVHRRRPYFWLLTPAEVHYTVVSAPLASEVLVHTDTGRAGTHVNVLCLIVQAIAAL